MLQRVSDAGERGQNDFVAWVASADIVADECARAQSLGRWLAARRHGDGDAGWQQGDAHASGDGNAAAGFAGGYEDWKDGGNGRASLPCGSGVDDSKGEELDGRVGIGGHVGQQGGGGSRESPSGEGQQTQTSVEGDRAGWIVGVITLRPCNTHTVVSTIWITYSSIRRPIVVTEARGRPQDFK